MSDLLFANLPWDELALALVLCLAVSALGFVRVDWFISIGYGFSIAAQAVLFAIVYRGQLSPMLLAQLMLLLAYGLRLALYLISRERSAAFGGELQASRERSAAIKDGVRFAIWGSVAALYVAMASPALFSLSAAAQAMTIPSLVPGLLVALCGLVLEAAADRQKSVLKAANPRSFVQSGLFAIVRSPNYLGEMLFWLGIFISGIGAYQSAGNWLIAGIGLVCIELIMLGSARRLELKQAERYAGDTAYADYVRRVPILFPLLPLYSLRNLKIYLG